MTTETSSTDGGQAPTSGTPQVGTSTTDGQAPVSQTQPTEHERIIAELRKEQASNRVELKKLKDAEEARQIAALSDAEKLQKRAEAAEKQIQTYKQELIASQVKLAAQQKGIVNPDLIAPYLQGKLEYGDDGMPTNLDKVLNDLLTNNPYLLTQQQRPAPTAGGATSPSRSASTSVGQITMESIASMTNEQYSQMTESQRQEVTRLLLNKGRR